MSDLKKHIEFFEYSDVMGKLYADCSYADQLYVDDFNSDGKDQGDGWHSDAYINRRAKIKEYINAEGNIWHNSSASERRKKRRAKRKAFWGNFKHMFLHLNPLTALMRGGFLLAMELNIGGMATKSYPGVVSDEEALKKGYDKNFLPKGKKAFEHNKKLHLNLGGDIKGLIKNIKKGAHKKALTLKSIIGKKHADGADGSFYYNVIGVATILTAVGSIVAAITGTNKSTGNAKVFSDPAKNEGFVNDAGKDSDNIPPDKTVVELQRQGILDDDSIPQEQKQAALDYMDKTITTHPADINNIDLLKTTITNDPNLTAKQKTDYLSVIGKTFAGTSKMSASGNNLNEVKNYIKLHKTLTSQQKTDTLATLNNLTNPKSDKKGFDWSQGLAWAGFGVGMVMTTIGIISKTKK